MGGAGVAVDEVAIVAGFVIGRALGDVCTRNTISAGRSCTAVGTGVVAYNVPIITGLNPALDDAIAAARSLANVSAGVAIDEVAIVALFLSANDPVAAARLKASVGAGVFVDLVSIIAIFSTQPKVAVAAARILASCCAGVRVTAVSIVALLGAGA